MHFIRINQFFFTPNIHNFSWSTSQIKGQKSILKRYAFSWMIFVNVFMGNFDNLIFDKIDIFQQPNLSLNFFTRRDTILEYPLQLIKVIKLRKLLLFLILI